MKSKDLLSKLSVLESLLHDFSYEELSGKEASYLKKSFESFKTDLENLVYGQLDPLQAVDERPLISQKNNNEADGVEIRSSRLKTSPVAKGPSNGYMISGMKVLIFEDNHLSQRLIDLQLTQYNCEAFVTDKPDIGLKILEENHIDIILMDIRMPLMSGFDIARLIRKSRDRRISSIPIIAISADISLQDKEKCRTSGINDFILKPYSVEELCFKIVKYARPDEEIASNSDPLDGSRPDKHTTIDITALLKECDGDVELLQDLVLLFKQNSLEFIKVSKKAIADSDSETLKFAAHKIKNGLAMLRASDLREVALNIYRGCEENMTWEKLKSLCDQYTESYQLAEKALDVQMEALRQQ